MPHDDDFNPFKLVLKEGGFKSGEKKDPHQIQREELDEIVREIKHIRDRGVVMTQLKIGSRATATCNIKLSHVSLQNEEVRDHYSELGLHTRLDGRENAIYIPHDVTGNKSKRPRVVPLDEEMRRVLIPWLLLRPDTDESYLSLSDSTNSQMERGAINAIWQKWFPEDYLQETEVYKPVTSHYGRHWFSTYWEHQDISRELLKYLRGDKTSKDSIDDSDAVNDYIHTYYEDIGEMYRE